MMKKYLLASIIAIVFSTILKAQTNNDTSHYIIKGIVFDDSTKNAIYGASVWLSKGKSLT